MNEATGLNPSRIMNQEIADTDATYKASSLVRWLTRDATTLLLSCVLLGLSVLWLILYNVIEDGPFDMWQTGEIAPLLHLAGGVAVTVIVLCYRIDIRLLVAAPVAWEVFEYAMHPSGFFHFVQMYWFWDSVVDIILFYVGAWIVFREWNRDRETTIPQ